MLNNLPNHDVLAEVGGQHHNTDLFDMSILHQALQLNEQKLVDFILVASKNVNINLMSPTHGTPLHIACKTGNIKIVQKLILSGAQITVAHNGKQPKESTKNQKIVYLLEKYEKIQDILQKRMEEKKEEEKGDLDNNTSSVYLMTHEDQVEEENEQENQ